MSSKPGATEGRNTGNDTALESIVQDLFSCMATTRGGHEARLDTREIGRVSLVSTGIAHVTGLPGVGADELLRFQGNEYGIAFNVDEEEVGVVLLGDYAGIQTGTIVQRTGRVMDVGVGAGLLGRVINPLGRALDGRGVVVTAARLPIERPAPAIMDRAPVTTPLQTGIKVIDALVPVGRGQRELILGDRQTGKTTIAIDTILNQKDQNVLCIYCAIGQRASAVARNIAVLRASGAMDYTMVMVAEGSDAPGLSYIAPYAATSIAEFFMESGRDVLVVYDDLTQHARAYREISLLMRRPAGREAFPGDIFYIHARLLERATRLNAELGGGSLTALPIIETEAQNISAYIPTNLISITDGQIILSPDLFELGVLPALDVGKSVSRVGGKAQHPAYQAVTGGLKLSYAQFEEMETFARFGARLDKRSRELIAHGVRIRACLAQGEHAPVTLSAQILVLLALGEQLFDEVPLALMPSAEAAVQQAAGRIPAAIMARFGKNTRLDTDEHAALLQLVKSSLAAWQQENQDTEPRAVVAPTASAAAGLTEAPMT